MHGINGYELGIVRSVTFNETDININTDRYNILGKACGDCCSQSYLRNPKNFDDMIGKQIIRVEHESVDPDDDKREYNDKIGGDFYSYHLYKFVLDDDTFSSLELYNISNGYYDGWLDFDIDELDDD